MRNGLKIYKISLVNSNNWTAYEWKDTKIEIHTSMTAVNLFNQFRCCQKLCDLYNFEMFDPQYSVTRKCTIKRKN